MSQLGYDERDVFRAIETVVKWGLVEPESLIIDSLSEDDAVRMHASGFIHMRFFLQRSEYVLGLTTNLRFSSQDVAAEIGQLWAGQDHLPDLQLASKVKILSIMRDHIRFEYNRRCRRHPFYEEHGLGGRFALEAIERAAYHLENTLRPTPHGIAAAPRRTTLGYRPHSR